MIDAPRPDDPPAPTTPPPHGQRGPAATAPRGASSLTATGTRVMALAGLALLPWFAAHVLRPPAPTVVMVIGALPAPTSSEGAPPPATRGTITQCPPPATVGVVTQQPPPPPPQVVAPTVAPVLAVSPERAVQVRWGTGWYPATVVRHECGRFERIQFTGYGPEWEEVVSTDEIRDPARPARPGAVLPADTDVAEPEGPTLTQQDRVTVGMALDGNYHGTWYPVHVLQVRSDGGVRIRYDGYGAEWDETMTRAQLRRRGTGENRESSSAPGGAAVDGQTTLVQGQRIWARSGGTWYLADVLNGECDGLVRVHYRGWDRAWDEVMPRDRLRLPAATNAANNAQSRPAPQE